MEYIPIGKLKSHIRREKTKNFLSKVGFGIKKGYEKSKPGMKRFASFSGKTLRAGGKYAGKAFVKGSKAASKAAIKGIKEYQKKQKKTNIKRKKPADLFGGDLFSSKGNDIYDNIIYGKSKKKKEKKDYFDVF